MLGKRNWLAMIATVALVAAPAAATTVDEVIAKHIEAKGGKARWDSVESMRLTGDFTAFSLVHPFTLTRARGDRYLMDHMLGDKLAIIGNDGKKAWWENHWFGEGAAEIGGADLPVIAREVDFATPFFEIAEKGHKVELIGESEYEGFPTIAIKLTRADESEETWHLDPETYLEFARTSPGSDFGRALEQRTIFDDFRKVDGIMLAHYVESQWYTRDRVMVVENVELNPTVDEAMFRMPAPPGMDIFHSMAGDWNVVDEQRQSPQAEFAPSERTSKIEFLMKRALVRESYETAQGAVMRTFSYDRFGKKYRVTRIDDTRGQMDIQEGEIGDDGTLTVSNQETGTSFEVSGLTVMTRTQLKEITDDSFKVEVIVSIDNGENWWTAVKSTYTRAEEAEEVAQEDG